MAAGDMGHSSLEGQVATPEARSGEVAAEEAGLHGVSSSSTTSGSEEEQKRREVQQLWFDAIKLPLYSVAVNPIVVPVPDSFCLLCFCTLDFILWKN